MFVSKRVTGRSVVPPDQAFRLSAGSLNAIMNIPGIGAELEPFRGLPAPVGGRVMLNNILVDDSPSIGLDDKDQLVRVVHNQLGSAMMDSDMANHTLVHTRCVSGTVINSFEPLEQANPLGRWNFQIAAARNTTFYDQAAIFLATVALKISELQAAGSRVQSLSMLITDAVDCRSGFVKPSQVSRLVRDLYRTGRHMVLGMGVNEKIDCRPMFNSMGILDEFIICPPEDDYYLTA